MHTQSAAHATPDISVELKESLIIRPLRHSDSIIEVEFFDDLSFDRKRNRFLGGVACVSQDEIDRLCDLDYHDSMAYVALRDNGKYVTELGIARYAKGKTKESHEMAIVLADHIDIQDVGQQLLTHLFEYARKNGIKRLHSFEFWDNQEMKLLAKSMGMSRETDPADFHQVIYSIDLNT